MKNEITIGLVGAGKGAELEMSALKKTCGIPIRFKTVVARRKEQLIPFQMKYGFDNISFDIDEILHDKEIDTVCICTPPYAHEKLLIESMEAGKDVICEKPLIGYFGEKDDSSPIGFSVSRKKMLDIVLKKLDNLFSISRKTGKKIMYAENAIYAPTIQQAGQIIIAKKSRILYARGEESLKGSTSLVANEWNKTGGGTFIRNATHPLSSILWLKQQEAKAHNKPISITSIIADMGMVTPTLDPYEHRHIDAHPQDVEDSGTAIITFSDLSKALVIATNTYLGGLRDYVELYCNDATLKCKLTLNDNLQSYFLDEDGIKDMSLSYLLPSKLGWNNLFISDEVLRGYVNEMQDFVEAIYYDRNPLSGLELASETTKAIYVAYLSAELEKKVTF